MGRFCPRAGVLLVVTATELALAVVVAARVAVIWNNFWCTVKCAAAENQGISYPEAKHAEEFQLKGLEILA
eukprot:238141-Amphidinium_carterae.1